MNSLTLNDLHEGECFRLVGSDSVYRIISFEMQGVRVKNDANEIEYFKYSCPCFWAVDLDYDACVGRLPAHQNEQTPFWEFDETDDLPF